MASTPPATNPIPECALDFSSVIESAVEGYLTRPAIEHEVDCFLNAANCGCCIVEGEPGSGKTSLAASFIRARGLLHHFLRPGHTEFSLWKDPHAFLTSLGFQLKALYGDAIFPEAVAVDLQGHIRDVEAGANFIGQTIEQLVTVPWHSATLNVRLNAARIGGNVIGMTIKQVIEDYRRIPPSTFAQMALFGPLRRLKVLRPEVHIALWVDGLDEQADSDQGLTVAELLPLPEELADLGNLSLLLSSRPGRHLDRFLNAGVIRLDLGDSAFGRDNTELVVRYVDRELASPEVQTKITEFGKPPEEVREAVLKASGHNLLYLRHFFTATRDGELKALMRGGLPGTLEGIYVRLLEEIVKSTGEGYDTAWHPLVSCLAVAQRSLSPAQLRLFTAFENVQLNRVLTRLRPFLDPTQLRIPSYGFYHKSFCDCLTSGAYEDKLWHVDAQAAHRRIVDAYLPAGESSLGPLDGYGFDYLTDHLANGGTDLQARLHSLLGAEWRSSKRAHYGSNLAFENDLERSARCARTLPPELATIITARAALMHILMDRVRGQLPEGAIQVMVRLGQVQRVFDFLQNVESPHVAARLLGQVIAACAQIGAPGRPLLLRTLRQGLDRLAPDPDHGSLAALLENCPIDAGKDFEPLLGRAYEIFNSANQSWLTARAMSELARLVTAFHSGSAAETFQSTLEVINKTLTASKSLEFRRLICNWVAFDSQAALHVLSAQKLPQDAESVAAILLVGRALAGKLPNFISQIQSNFLAHMQDPYELACAAADVLKAQLEIGDRTGSAATLVAMNGALSRIGSTLDPAAGVSNRMDQATTAHVFAAEAAMQLSKADGVAHLRHAWSLYLQHGYFRSRSVPQILVRTQAAAGRDLLEANIESVTDAKRQAELLMAWADELLQTDATESSRLLERALMLTETPAVYRVDREEFGLALASALPETERTDTVRYLERIEAKPEAVLEWRADVLRRLVQNDFTEAHEWCVATIRSWSKAETLGSMFNLPSAIGTLPAEFLALLTPVIPELPHLHQALLASAVGAGLNRIDPSSADSLLALALGLADQAKAPGVRAFIAGQWWKNDSGRATAWLTDLLQQLDAEAAQAVILDFMKGAPAAGLPYLLALAKPAAPPQDTVSFVMPGAGVPPHVLAGMSRRDYAIAVALGEQAAIGEAGEGDRVAGLGDDARVLTLCTAAKAARETPLDLRLAWIEAATETASRLEEHHMKCLLLADAALAFFEAGFRKRGYELAAATASEVLDRGDHFEGVKRASGYSHALGRCFQVLASEPHREDLPEIIWKARRLGSGLHACLGYLALSEMGKDPAWVHSLQAAEEEAIALY